MPSNTWRIGAVRHHALIAIDADDSCSVRTSGEIGETTLGLRQRHGATSTTEEGLAKLRIESALRGLGRIDGRRRDLADRLREPEMLQAARDVIRG
jgi:hypothetical protein